MEVEIQQVEDMILNEVHRNQDLLLDLVERVAKLEVKHSWMAGVYGVFGGFIASLAMYFGFKGG